MNKPTTLLSNCKYIFFFSLVTVLLASSTTGCSSATAGAANYKRIPSSHAWQYLQFYGGEELGYATYSYLLVGRDDSNQKSTTLYYDLIKAVKGSAINTRNIKNIVSKNSLNLFIIPKSEAEPDYELSKSLLAKLSATSTIKFSRPGPFIITLERPISTNRGDKIADILYFDLTNSHRIAIPEIVRTYNEQVINEELKGIEKLNSIRLSLLNFALRGEDSIGFAKSAYADMRSAFSE